MGTILVIRNIADSTESYDLEDMFSTVGDVVSASIRLDMSTGTERRVGVIQMATEEAAQDAITRFHGTQKDGRTVVVLEDAPHVPKPGFRKVNKVKATKARRVTPVKARSTAAKAPAAQAKA